MIYFDNVKITNDKKLVGIVKSDNNQIQVGDVIITTQDYYSKEQDYQRIITPDEKTEITGGYSFEVNMATAQMIKIGDPNKDFNLDKDLIILTSGVQVLSLLSNYFWLFLLLVYIHLHTLKENLSFIAYLSNSMTIL